MSDFWGLVGMILLTLVGAIALLAVAFVLVYPLNKKSCSAAWQNSGMQTRFGVFEGCLLQLPDGTWVPASSYRPVKEAK